MTEFVETAMRHMCRSADSKLSKTVSNPREAFCARGCDTGFYLPLHRLRESDGMLEIQLPQRLAGRSGFGRFISAKPFGKGFQTGIERLQLLWREYIPPLVDFAPTEIAHCGSTLVC